MGPLFIVFQKEKDLLSGVETEADRRGVQTENGRSHGRGKAREGPADGSGGDEGRDAAAGEEAGKEDPAGPKTVEKLASAFDAFFGDESIQPAPTSFVFLTEKTETIERKISTIDAESRSRESERKREPAFGGEDAGRDAGEVFTDESAEENKQDENQRRSMVVMQLLEPVHCSEC